MKHLYVVLQKSGAGIFLILSFFRFFDPKSKKNGHFLPFLPFFATFGVKNWAKIKKSGKFLRHFFKASYKDAPQTNFGKKVQKGQRLRDFPQNLG